MISFRITCSQRGCTSRVEAAVAPALCPVCENPLLEGDVAEIPDGGDGGDEDDPEE